MNDYLLGYTMHQNGITKKELADKLSINPTTLYRKMSGETEFTRIEILNIKKILKLSQEKVDAIFFEQ